LFIPEDIEMAIQTPITNSIFENVAGGLRMEVSKFTSVANGDTYTPAVGIIVGLSVDGGSTAGTIGATWTNATPGTSPPVAAAVTFSVSTGSITNVSLILFGY
jgi:hypothetical protein